MATSRWRGRPPDVEAGQQQLPPMNGKRDATAGWSQHGARATATTIAASRRDAGVEALDAGHALASTLRVRLAGHHEPDAAGRRAGDTGAGPRPPRRPGCPTAPPINEWRSCSAAPGEPGHPHGAGRVEAHAEGDAEPAGRGLRTGTGWPRGRRGSSSGGEHQWCHRQDHGAGPSLGGQGVALVGELESLAQGRRHAVERSAGVAPTPVARARATAASRVPWSGCCAVQPSSTVDHRWPRSARFARAVSSGPSGACPRAASASAWGSDDPVRRAAAMRSSASGSWAPPPPSAACSPPPGHATRADPGDARTDRRAPRCRTSAITTTATAMMPAATSPLGRVPSPRARRPSDQAGDASPGSVPGRAGPPWSERGARASRRFGRRSGPCRPSGAAGRALQAALDRAVAGHRARPVGIVGVVGDLGHGHDPAAAVEPPGHLDHEVDGAGDLLAHRRQRQVDAAPSGPSSRAGAGRRPGRWRGRSTASPRGRCSSPAACRGPRRRGPRRRRCGRAACAARCARGRGRAPAGSPSALAGRASRRTTWSPGRRSSAASSTVTTRSPDGQVAGQGVEQRGLARAGAAARRPCSAGTRPPSGAGRRPPAGRSRRAGTAAAPKRRMVRHGPVDRQRRHDRVDPGAVGQAGVDERRRAVDPQARAAPPPARSSGSTGGRVEDDRRCARAGRPARPTPGPGR